MKTWKYGIIGILAIAAILLSACTLYLNEQGDTGTVTVNITIDDGNSTVDWLGELTPKDLVHTIQLFDKNGEEQYRAENLSYGHKSSFSVTPGLYTFYVEAFYNGDLKATGREERTIVAGKNPAITIQMGPATVRTIFLTGITAVYTPDPDNPILTDTNLETLKEGLTVTAHYSDGTTAPVTDYTLSVEGGEFTVGENTVTVHYTEGVITETNIFTVTVYATHEHNWSEWTTTTPATCTTAGVEVRECTADPPHHDDRLIPIDPDAHDSGEWHITLAATCIATGTKELRCTRDDVVLETDTIDIDPNAHDYQTYTEILAPTCTTVGKEEALCARNSTHEKDIRDIPVDLDNGHDWKDEWTHTANANCTTAEVETDICNFNAGHTRTRAGAPINPNAHDWNTTTTATASAAGTETGVCRHNSSHTYTRNVLAPMVFVPTGSFQLGMDVGTGEPVFTPVSNVTLSGFFIGKYEITQSQWYAVMGSWPSNLFINNNYGKGDDCPIYHVTSYYAIIFCNRLSIMEGLTPAYRILDSTNPDDWGTPAWNDTWNGATIDSDANGYRLPTEAQWEYAAKGGNPLAPGWVGYTYPGSNTPNDVAWHNYNGGGNGPYPVGTRAPNSLGIYDMSGNVWEWCWDWRDNYTAEDKIDPIGPPSSPLGRIIRGGAWTSTAGDSRSAYRVFQSAASSSNDRGFRIARPVGVPLGNGESGAVAVTGITTAPRLRDGSPVSLTAPRIHNFSGSTITAQGWQISDDGTSGWSNLTATTVNMSLDGKYLRYYATSGGITYYSPNPVTIKVLSLTAREVTINMYDSYNDGWNGGSLRINVNGTDIATGVKVHTSSSGTNTPSGQTSSNTYTFLVEAGEVVQLYWLGGQYQEENSFIAYYTDTPPDPAFPPNSTDWDGENALVFRLRNTMNSTAASMLGSFTVP